MEERERGATKQMLRESHKESHKHKARGKSLRAKAAFCTSAPSSLNSCSNSEVRPRHADSRMRVCERTEDTKGR